MYVSSTIVDVKNIILGAGVTGLAAGHATGFDIYEAAGHPGGICSSYCYNPDSGERRFSAERAAHEYLFELGGGHWIFGGDEKVVAFMKQFAELQRYTRNSAVYFPQRELYVPYPLQYNLWALPDKLRAAALEDIEQGEDIEVRTMRDWLLKHFGKTLCELFFFPFHSLYTAQLTDSISPQDAYKSPVDIELLKKGMREPIEDTGYNASFVYPATSLTSMMQAIAKRQEVHYGKRVTAIGPEGKQLQFEDGSSAEYETLLSTLPLHEMQRLTGIEAGTPDPHTSVVVLNIAAERSEETPNYHWLYVPHSRSGFHRIGFYSNVDELFLPSGERGGKRVTSLYVERSYRSDAALTDSEIHTYKSAAIRELQDWGLIGDVIACDPTIIETAYTWRRPDSTWREDALDALDGLGITQLGRYGQWRFQGISASIKEGLAAGE